MSDELLPCPFCGSIEIETMYNDECDGHVVTCRRCDADGPFCRQESVAVNLWNVRASTGLDALLKKQERERCISIQAATNIALALNYSHRSGSPIQQITCGLLGDASDLGNLVDGFVEIIAPLIEVEFEKIRALPTVGEK